MENAAAEFLTAAEVAARLKVHVQTVYRWGEDGTLPGRFQVGNTVRFRRAAVDAFLAGGVPREDGEPKAVGQ